MDRQKRRKKSSNLHFALIWTAVLAASLVGISIAHYGSVPSWAKAIRGHFLKGPVICIDAGHGGDDTGASSGDQIEKEQTLKIAQLVADDLESDGIRVVMTRDDDSTTSLESRVQTANDAGALGFVSIHRNMYNGTKTDVKGVEIWTSHDGEAGGTELARLVLKRLTDTGYVTSRGIKGGSMDDPDTDYYVIRNTQMPSILIELGFLSSEDDRAMVEEYADVTARAIADGIEDWISEQTETESTT
jgi:N-acetylmuramoyl-L-alanine amidase